MTDHPLATPIPLNDTSKADWRVWAKTMRQDLQQSGQLATIHQGMLDQLCQWPDFQAAPIILSYAAIGDELDLLPLLQQFPKKHWYFPRTSGPLMTFHRIRHANDLQIRTESGVAIPEPTDSEPLLSEPPSLLLLPALCVDGEGFRLGYGKGYYDRWLSQQRLRVPSAVLVPEVLCVPELPRDTWDLPAQTIITERDSFTVL